MLKGWKQSLFYFDFKQVDYFLNNTSLKFLYLLFV